MFEIADSKKEKRAGAKITVIGVGGAGCNAVNTMIAAGLEGVNYVVANTDSQALDASDAEIKIQMGLELTKGLGAGANPEVGKKAALEDFESITETLIDSDLVFITAGMGGGTGTGAAPIISKLAKDLGALTVGVVTKPFSFEGKKRMNQALGGINELKPNVDSLIIIPNEKLLEVAGEDLSLIDTFKKADEVLLNAVQGIADLINNTGLINSDFADVATIMGNKGTAIMGTGYASGEDRALKAAQAAITSPLLEDAKIDGATGVIVNISGNKEIKTFEANQAMKFIMDEADENAEVIFGTVINPDMEEEVKVTVIATGIQQEAYMNTNPIPKTKSTREPVSEPVHQMVGRSLPAAAPVFESSFKEEEKFPAEEVTISEYEANLAAKEIEKFEAQQEEDARVSEHRAAQQSHDVSQRTKSIAERLGFMSFDEDEFDTPSYLRKSESKPTEPDNA